MLRLVPLCQDDGVLPTGSVISTSQNIEDNSPGYRANFTSPTEVGASTAFASSPALEISLDSVLVWGTGGSSGPMMPDSSIGPFNIPHAEKSACDTASLSWCWLISNIWPSASLRFVRRHGSLTADLCWDSVINEHSPLGASNCWMRDL